MIGEPISYRAYFRTPKEFKPKQFIKIERGMKKVINCVGFRTYKTRIEDDGKEYINTTIYLGFDDETFTYVTSPSNSKLLGQFCRYFDYELPHEFDEPVYDYFETDDDEPVRFEQEITVSKKSGKSFPTYWVVSE